jgi:hypothetical protein
VNVDALTPRRHAPPKGWDAATFERLTSALALALAAAVKRAEAEAADGTGPQSAAKRAGQQAVNLLQRPATGGGGSR